MSDGSFKLGLLEKPGGDQPSRLAWKDARQPDMVGAFLLMSRRVKAVL
jgi:hypothetical protein